MKIFAPIIALIAIIIGILATAIHWFAMAVLVILSALGWTLANLSNFYGGYNISLFFLNRLSDGMEIPAKIEPGSAWDIDDNEFIE
jgi:hypothetical protein